MKLVRKIKMYQLTGRYKDRKVEKIVKFFNEILSNMKEYHSVKMKTVGENISEQLGDLKHSFKRSTKSRWEKINY